MMKNTSEFIYIAIRDSIYAAAAAYFLSGIIRDPGSDLWRYSCLLISLRCLLKNGVQDAIHDAIRELNSTDCHDCSDCSDCSDR